MSSALQHFEKKCINSQSKIGGLFFEKRENQKLSLEEVSKALKIRKVFLIAIENDNFDLLPGGVYNIGFIKNYAKFLDIDFDLILQKIMSEERRQEEDCNKESYFNVSKEFKPEKNVKSFYVIVSIILMVVFAIISYFYDERSDTKNIPNEENLEDIKLNQKTQENSADLKKLNDCIEENSQDKQLL
jgi:cytoskeleton protein RodZ